jgi:hypothetical protein
MGGKTMSNQLLLRRRTMLGQSKEVAIHGIPPISITGKRNLLSVKAFGECVQNGTPTPDNPVDIVCNNGVLKYGVLGKNLFDGTVYNIAYLSSPSRVAYNASYRGIIIPVIAGNKYTISRQTVEGNRFNWYFTPTYPQNGDTPYNIGSTTETSLSATVTVPNGMSFLVVYFATNASDISQSEIQVELGNTATPYEPYRTGIYADGTVETIEDTIGNTATAEMLLKVGNHQDVQSIIDGVVTRNVGVCVYDGSQNIGNTFISTTGGKDIGAIIVYPLATSTTEQVAGQILALTSGTNIIDITQASLQGLELEVMAK